MIVGEATVTVAASPREVLEFVLDLERYREADHKIGRIGRVTLEGDSGTAEFAGRIRGIPGPMSTYPFTLTRWSRLAFGSPVAGPARALLDFEGSFDCRPADDGTVVTHREAFAFKQPLRLAAEPFLRRWLEQDTVEEMERVRQALDGRG